MTNRLVITPEGVGETMNVGITSMNNPSGRNGVVVLNDTYEVASDGTYENVE